MSRPIEGGSLAKGNDSALHADNMQVKHAK